MIIRPSLYQLVVRRLLLATRHVRRAVDPTRVCLSRKGTVKSGNLFDSDVSVGVTLPRKYVMGLNMTV